MTSIATLAHPESDVGSSQCPLSYPHKLGFTSDNDDYTSATIMSGGNWTSLTVELPSGGRERWPIEMWYLLARDWTRCIPTSILQGVMATMGLQLRNLLLTTYSLVCAFDPVGIYAKAFTDNMNIFLEKNLDTESQRKIHLLEYDALGVLCKLCVIDAEVTTLIQAYAEHTYERAYHRYDPGVVLPSLQLASVEKYRMTRASYRLKLFQVLYYNYTDRLEIDFESSGAYGAFLQSFKCL
ncbi:hypothetical protein EK21DRAFT_90558 [Setomelanomma holmii]|uniref:Uncharacterized protein n=1 Tax=Setomelanomma holmii TaxID=210430 RepID=A0A9P4H5J4_9PLEO|nr:hypothetical protein EK21DRAFT_90558 [Setomelanomma holmii]